MPSSPRENMILKWETLSLIERFGNVLYPLDVVDLLRQLPKLGYIVAERVLRGAILEPGQPLAIKGDVELRINQDNKTLGVVGRDVESVQEAFQNLRQLWMEQLDTSPNICTDYVEIDGSGWAKGQRNPIEVFGKWRGGLTKIEALGKVLGCDVTTFGLHLCVPNTDPNSPNWFDIRITPSVVSGAARYLVRAIWREQEVESVMRRFKNLDDTVRDLILEIEKT